MNEKKYDLLGVKYVGFANSISVRLLETSYVYERRGKNAEELVVRKRKTKLKLKVTPEVLEGLPKHENEAVRIFCEQIAEIASEAGRCPQWYKILLTERLWEQTRAKLLRERETVNAKYDSTVLPYREKAKHLSACLMSFYDDRARCERSVRKARSECVRFEKRYGNLLFRMIFCKYIKKKQKELDDALESARSGLDIAEKNISGIERELHEAALGITSIEHRRNTELERVRANYRLAEESFSNSLDTLKCTKN
jgi:hypothetical protein